MEMKIIMIKLPVEDFIFEVKEEILSYEELGNAKADEWEVKFNNWLNNDKIKKKNVKVSGDKKFYLIDDESEIFDIADLYYSAVEQKKEEEYWKKFQ